LLTATLALEPAHPLVGPLVETLVVQGRSERRYWNTQDYGSVLTALADFARRDRVPSARPVVVRSGSRVITRLDRQNIGVADTSVTLGALLGSRGAGSALRLDLSVEGSGDRPEFYSITVHEVPRRAPVKPDQQGVQVERWYEDYATGKPLVEVAEGDLVRVRLRVTSSATRQFLVVDDPLPAGLEAVDLSLRTATATTGPGVGAEGGNQPDDQAGREGTDALVPYGWYFGSWDSGWWSPFDHRELRDDRVVYVATELWAGTYTASYVARATTPGVFIRPPAHAEEMYNPAVQGRSDGGVFTVTARSR
jgi:uncharacterized protein YfaS (alpha-2-macroglobulin family)